MHRSPIVVYVSLFLLEGGSAYAQDKGQVGLTMGFPGNIGVTWHATDRIAVRPAFSFSHAWGESTFASASFEGPGFSVSTFTATSTHSSWTVGTELSVLIYVKKWDNVRAYVAPSYGYSQATTTTTFTTSGRLPPEIVIGGVGNETRKSKSHGHSGGGIFGVQFTPHRRFGVFGEVGLRYSSSRSRESRTNGVANTSRAGVVFYF